MAAAAIDIPLLAAYTEVSEDTITTLIQAPTVQLVQSFLASISAKAVDFEQLKSRNLRLDVELESVKRSAEAKAKVQSAINAKALSENASLRDSLQKEETTRAELESQLERIKANTSGSETETASLKTRIASLESSNRDTLALLESKTTAYDELAKDLSAQHQKTVELRRQVTSLEQTIQANNSSAATIRVRMQNLEQEVDLAKKNGEWYQNELRTKQEEYMKYRKEKGAKIAELQRTNEDVNATVDALRRTEAALRNRLAEVEQKFEDSLTNVQQLQEESARSEENHRKEYDRVHRLAQLRERAAETEKKRVQDFQEALEQAKDEAAEEIGRVRAEVETEHAEREAAEERIAELESTVERLEGELTDARERPLTPIRGLNGAGSNTPSRAGTPSRAFSPASSRMKSNVTMTQMYSEYSTMKSQLIKEQRNSEQYKATLDELLQDLEALRPELESLRTRNADLEEEMNNMSSLVDSFTKEKDAARKEARKAESNAHKLVGERNIFKQQVVDLSAQVRYLVLQNHLLQQGENLTQKDMAELEAAAEQQIQDQEMEGLSDTGRIISQRLVVFRNVTELQEKNAELIRMLRQVTDQMESAESRDKEDQYRKAQSELLDLQSRVRVFEDEARNMNARANGYLKERDIYRRLLSKRGQLPDEGDGSSIINPDSVPATPTGHTFNNSTSKEVSDYAKLIKEMQAHFDAFRQESHTDMQTLRQQNDSLAREKGSLQGDIARVNGQLSLANQRNEMLQGNYNMLRNENDMLQKRVQTMMENATKQDLRTQSAVEELVETKSLMDSLRNETATLKAEKGVWKGVEKRLLEENEYSRNERDRLNKLSANLQLLNNERESADADIRRRQQATIDNLESELQSVRRKLNEEVEEAKKFSLRKEYDQQQNQKRIDDLMVALGNVREELAGAKTARDHLQARVDELEIELKASEERAAALQPKPVDALRQSPGGQTQEALSREQELALEVSDLKRELELAKAEVERAKEQVEQYKAISQDTEEQLQSLNETADQYREETDRELGEKDKKIEELQQQTTDLESELTTSNTELSSLQDQKGELNRQISQQKAESEAEITRLKDEVEQQALTAKYHEDNLKAQAEIAQKSQQYYEEELVKHSAATQQLQTLRAETNELRATVVDLRANAESTKTVLAQKEEAWAEARDRYDSEIADLKKRREEVQHQNDLLHGQLEAITQQIASLKHDRASLFTGDETDSDNLDLAALQEVIAYLRREKAIMEVQYDIVQADAKRLQRDLDHANAQLDGLRTKISQERQRDAENERHTLDHNKLLETINELNLYRESSVTLRNEARRAETALAEKSKLVEELRDQIQPLQARVQELEDINETQAGEAKLLEEDRNRWRERTNNIMSKYDRVDPAELESLRTQIQTLTTERDEAMATMGPLQEQITTAQNALKEGEERWQTSRAKLVDQFKARSRELSAKINAGVTDLQTAIAEKEALRQELDSSKETLENMKAEHSQALANAAVKPTAPASPPTQVDSSTPNGVEEGETTETTPTATATNDQVKHLEETVSQLEEKLQAAEAKAEAEASRADELQKQVDHHVKEIEDLNHHIDELQGQVKGTQDSLNQLLESRVKSTDEGTVEDVSDLREQLTQKEAEIEDLKTRAAVSASTASIAVESGQKPIAEKIQEQVDSIRAELEASHKTRLEELEIQYNHRADRMKTALNKTLGEKRDAWRIEGRETSRRELEEAHSQALEQLKKEHEAEVASLNQTHQDEIKRVKDDEEIRLKQEKAIWMAEHGAPTPTPQQAQSFDVSQITDAQARELITKNQIVRSVLQGNIAKKLAAEKETLTSQFNQEKETLTARLNEEHEKVRSSALSMQEKKTSVQLSMAATNRAKLVVVEKAARETPEKPVKEVWDVAKSAKAQPPASATSAPSVPGTPAAGANATTAPPDAAPATPTPPQQRQQQQQQQQQQRQAPQPGQSAPPAPSPVRRDSATAPSPIQTRTSSPQQPTNQNQPNIPSKPLQGQPNTQPAARGSQSSQLPRGGGRGRGIPTPAQGHQANQAAGQGQQDVGSTLQGAMRGRGGGQRGQRGGGPGRGGGIPLPSQSNLNPQARQYVPGGKRPREDGQEGQEGNKRPRGGGPGS